MARILAIDYGTKRIGLAATDTLQIIASGLKTVPTSDIFSFLKGYLNDEEVERIVIGQPFYPDGNPAQLTPVIEKFKKQLEKLYPEIPVDWQDESFSSEEAKIIIRESGAKKKKRRDKALVDKVSAVVILENYMQRTGKW